MYPTLEDVRNASREQLARWYRFLPSPGASAIGLDRESFLTVLGREKEIMDLIVQRFQLLGGFTPELSKKIGW